MTKKRANGEGNIRKRKDGRWEGRYTAGRNEQGKLIYKNVLGRTQAEVKEKLAKAIEESKGLDVARAGQYTVGQWLDIWFENYAKVKVRPSSHATYRGYIKNHIKPYIGSITLNKLTSLDLQKLYKKLLTDGRIDRIESKNQPKGLCPKTVRNINQIISSAMKFAKSQKLITANPTESCALPRLEHKEMKTLTADQLAAFFREAKASGVYELYYLELATGLRRGELCGLDWPDIDLERKIVHVRKSRQSVTGGGVQVMPTKTASSVRTITIPDLLADVLREYRAWWSAERIRLGSAWQCGDAVFISRNGTLPHPDTITKTVTQFAVRHDLPHLAPHKLRHTFATIQIAGGVDVRTLMGRTGHSQAATLLNVYSHMLQQKEAAAAAVFDKAFGGKKG